MSNTITFENTGKKTFINNMRSVPIKIVIEGFSCGTAIEFGLTAGQFFAVTPGSTALTIRMVDMEITDKVHPGPPEFNT